MGKPTNSDQTIATKGSGHLAKSAPGADTCFIDKPKGIIFPATNVAPSANLGTGQTTKTFIEGQAIWTEKGFIDKGAPYPSGPPHPGVQKGTNVAAYCDKAWATDFSHDLKIETGGVVRTEDPTKQNNGNTDGKVYESGNAGDAKNTRTEKNLRCQVTTIKGQCKHGRPLSAPKNTQTNDGFSLDVYDSDTVTLEAEKAPVADGLPPCGKHVEWFAKNPTGKTGQPVTKGPQIGAKFTVEGDLFSSVFVKDLKIATGTTTATTAAADASATAALNKPDTPTPPRPTNDWKATSTRGTESSHIGTKGGALDMGTSSTTKAEEGKAFSAQGVATAKAVAGNFDTFMRLLMYANAPATVTVTAKGCAGAKTITLRAFPEDPFKFDLVEKLLEAFQTIKTVKETFERVTKLFDTKTDLAWLEKPVANITVQYVELKEQKNGFTPSQVRSKILANLGFAPLASITISVKLPVLQVLGPMAAGLDKIIRKLGVEINVVFTFSIAVNVNISAGKDEYDDFTASGSIAIAPKLSLKAEGVANALGGLKGELSIEGWVEGEIKLEALPCKSKQYLVDIDVTGFIQFGWKYTASIDLWGFYDCKKELEPEKQKPPEWRWPKKDAPPLKRWSIYKLSTP